MTRGRRRDGAGVTGARSVWAPDELHGLGPRGGVVAEETSYRRGHGEGARLLDAAHGHAQVLGLDDDEDAPRREDLLDGVGDLGRHALLDLEAAGVAVDEAGELGEAGDAAVLGRDVRDVGAAEERDEVVLAEGGEGDVTHHDHLVVLGREGDLEVTGRVVVEAGEELLVHGRDPVGRGEEAVAVGVLADGLEELVDGFSYALDVDTHGRHLMDGDGMDGSDLTGPFPCSGGRPGGCGSARRRPTRSPRRSRPGW